MPLSISLNLMMLVDTLVLLRYVPNFPKVRFIVQKRFFYTVSLRFYIKVSAIKLKVSIVFFML